MDLWISFNINFVKLKYNSIASNEGFTSKLSKIYNLETVT